MLGAKNYVTSTMIVIFDLQVYSKSFSFKLTNIVKILKIYRVFKPLECFEIFYLFSSDEPVSNRNDCYTARIPLGLTIDKL